MRAHNLPLGRKLRGTRSLARPRRLFVATVITASLCFLLALCRNQSSPTSPPEKLPSVPKVLHHMYKNMAAMSEQQLAFMTGCLSLNPGWRSLFWDDNSTDAFVREHYGWFYSVWASLHPPIKRVDSSRYMLMHHFGGIYVDLDVECVTEFDSLVEPLPYGAAWSGGYPDPMFLMSTPGNEFWLSMLESVQRSRNSSAFFDETGPGGLRRAFKRYVQQRGDGVLVPFLTQRPDLSPVTPFAGDIENNTVAWYAGKAIHEELDANATWLLPKLAPQNFRVGFVPNSLVDPGACKDHHCGKTTCGTQWPRAYTVHHCLGSWKGRIDT